MDETVIQTPYYLIDKSKLLINMEKIARLRELSGARALLALKCFATWGVFDFMADYMDGTTSSSLNEVRLGRERFGMTSATIADATAHSPPTPIATSNCSKPRYAPSDWTSISASSLCASN